MIPRPHARARATAVAMAVALLLVTSAPRLVLYRSAVLAGSALHVLVVLTEVGILAGLAARWADRPAAALFRAAGPVLAVGALAAWVELRLEAAAPGAIFPPVLYPQPPSLSLSLVMRATEAVLWTALWSLLYVFPLTLEAAREAGADADRWRRALALSRLRARIEPRRVQEALAAIGARLVEDPAGARERLAALADQLDASPASGDPRSADEEPPAPAAPALHAFAVPTPTLRDPRARARFAVAVGAIALLVTAGGLVRWAEHGVPAVRLEVAGAARIAAELVAFVILAERAARRARPVLGTVALSLAAAAAVGVAAALLKAWVEATFPGYLFPATLFTHPTPLSRQVTQALGNAPIHVGFWTLLYLFPLARAEADRRAALTSDLRREAELARLRATLTPHFVRNALNLIAGLVTADPEEAERLLVRLGDLLVELSRDEESHPLSCEVAWLCAYAELLEARHPGALSFRFEIDPRAGAAPVPRLLLQPLVENAVLHGALAREGGGEVRVVATVVETGGEARLRLAVEDDGPGMRVAGRVGGVGVRLVRERLATLGSGALDFESTPRGTRAIVEMPLGART